MTKSKRFLLTSLVASALALPGCDTPRWVMVLAVPKMGGSPANPCNYLLGTTPDQASATTTQITTKVRPDIATVWLIYNACGVSVDVTIKDDHNFVTPITGTHGFTIGGGLHFTVPGKMAHGKPVVEKAIGITRGNSKKDVKVVAKPSAAGELREAGDSRGQVQIDIVP